MSEKCATVFEGIMQRTEKVTGMVNSISGAASDQEAGIVQVGRAMSEMRHSADESDQMAHAISTLSGVLKDHSESLASTVERLETLVHGDINKPSLVRQDQEQDQDQEPPDMEGGNEIPS